MYFAQSSHLLLIKISAGNCDDCTNTHNDQYKHDDDDDNHYNCFAKWNSK